MKRRFLIVLAVLTFCAVFGVFASAAEEPHEVAGYDEMVSFIRDGLLAREETIRFRYTGDDYRAPSPDDLFAYGDNGAAGDYLRLSFNGAFPAAAQEEDGSYTVTPSYYTTAQQEAAVAAYVSDVLAGCTATGEEAVARYLYDYLCDNVQFDLENLYNEEDLLKYTAYGAVSEGKAVCQGFAQLYYRLAKAVGLDCRIVTGTRAGENHAWNIVKLGDKWYHVDAACGAQLLDNSGYFMKFQLNGYTILYGSYTASEIGSYALAGASASDLIETGALTYQITWTLDKKTGAMTLEGSGDTPSYTSTSENPLKGKYITSVIISDGITGLGDRLFSGFYQLTNVTMSDSVIFFGDAVFADCFRMTSITVSEGLKRIGKDAFYNCSALPEITIPDGVTEIGVDAFRNCDGLTEIFIPNSVISLGNEMPFINCSGLQEIRVGENNPVYHSAGNCLIDTKEKTVIRGAANSVIPDDGSVTRIGWAAFTECEGMTRIEIPDSVTYIGQIAFGSCTGLEEVILSDNLYFIGSRAFISCVKLKEINIPASVGMIESAPFSHCPGLERLSVDAANTTYHSDGNCLIETRTKKLVSGITGSVIPDDGSVTGIGYSAFNYLPDLQTMKIPSSVTTLEADAFGSCENLREIILPDTVTSIGGHAFGSSIHLRIVIPASVTNIGSYAFSSKAVIYGYEGSYAETYAADHNLRFLPICAVSKGFHTPVEMPATTVTCTEAGYTAGERCADCGEWISGHELTEAPLGHDPAEAVRENVVQPTCTAEGGYDNVIYCARCGELLSSTPEKLAMTPHRDEVRDGYCDDCGAYICEHTETKTANEKAASCTEDGYSGDTVCDICGVTLTYGQTIPAPGHKPYISKAAVSATCLATGSTAQVSCTVCQTVLTESVETPIVWHMDENGDGACDVCRAPLDCDRYGLCGDDCYWYVDNGTLVISGSGATYSYSDPAPWATDDFDYVYIKEGVTAVDGAAFNACANVTKVFAPAGTSVFGCEKPVLTYTFTDGVAAISGATGDGAFTAYDLLNAAYVLCLDHEVKGLRFDRLQLNAADGGEFTEYDILKSGKIVDENHFRLASGAVVSDFFVKPASYASFNRVQTLFGSEPDRNLILRVECGDLLTEEMKTDGNAYTEQLVLRFVDEPAPAEDGGHHGFMDSFIERFRATLAAILALFKKIIKLFTRR